MPKRKEPVMDSSIARDIFNELDLYAKDKQFYPIEHALYRHMKRYIRNDAGVLEPLYKFSKGEFRYWFGRLVDERYIEIDEDTRAIRCSHLMIVEKEQADSG